MTNNDFSGFFFLIHNDYMRKFKELRFNEKLLLALAIMLMAGIILKWPQVKEGFIKSWERFGVSLSKNK